MLMLGCQGVVLRGLRFKYLLTDLREMSLDVAIITLLVLRSAKLLQQQLSPWVSRLPTLPAGVVTAGDLDFQK